MELREIYELKVVDSNAISGNSILNNVPSPHKNKKARPIRNALSLFSYVFVELAALSGVELVQE